MVNFKNARLIFFSIIISSIFLKFTEIAITSIPIRDISEYKVALITFGLVLIICILYFFVIEKISTFSTLNKISELLLLFVLAIMPINIHKFVYSDGKWEVLFVYMIFLVGSLIIWLSIIWWDNKNDTDDSVKKSLKFIKICIYILSAVLLVLLGIIISQYVLQGGQNPIYEKLNPVNDSPLGSDIE